MDIFVAMPAYTHILWLWFPRCRRKEMFSILMSLGISQLLKHLSPKARHKQPRRGQATPFLLLSPRGPQAGLSAPQPPSGSGRLGLRGVEREGRWSGTRDRKSRKIIWHKSSQKLAIWSLIDPASRCGRNWKMELFYPVCAYFSQNELMPHWKGDLQLAFQAALLPGSGIIPIVVHTKGK